MEDDNMNERSLTTLAALALAVKAAKISIDEAVSTAFELGKNAGAIEGLRQAQQIMERKE